MPKGGRAVDDRVDGLLGRAVLIRTWRDEEKQCHSHGRGRRKGWSVGGFPPPGRTARFPFGHIGFTFCPPQVILETKFGHFE